MAFVIAYHDTSGSVPDDVLDERYPSRAEAQTALRCSINRHYWRLRIRWESPAKVVVFAPHGEDYVRWTVEEARS